MPAGWYWAVAYPRTVTITGRAQIDISGVPPTWPGGGPPWTRRWATTRASASPCNLPRAIRGCARGIRPRSWTVPVSRKRQLSKISRPHLTFRERGRAGQARTGVNRQMMTVHRRPGRRHHTSRTTASASRNQSGTPVSAQVCRYRVASTCVISRPQRLEPSPREFAKSLGIKAATPPYGVTAARDRGGLCHRPLGEGRPRERRGPACDTAGIMPAPLGAQATSTPDRTKPAAS